MREPPGPQELSVLFPDRDLTLAGETVAVRAFRFGESLRIRRLAAPIIEALSRAVRGEGDFDGEGFMAALYEHAEVLLELLSLATGKRRDWIEALPQADGEELVLAFWEANEDFFVHGIRRSALAAEFLKPPPPGGKSSPRSSPTATPPTVGNATPGGNSSSSTGPPAAASNAPGGSA